MKTIKTCELWTQSKANSDCIIDAFKDGWQNGVPYQRFKILLNCNCIIKSNTPMLRARNKHAMIIFYGEDSFRLCAIESGTNLRKMLNTALTSKVNGKPLYEILKSHNVCKKVVDLKESPIRGDNINNSEIISCDRVDKLEAVLGSKSGNNGDSEQSSRKNFVYLPNLGLMYSLNTDEEAFLIEHRGAFHAVDGSCTLAIQMHGKIKKDDIEQYK